MESTSRRTVLFSAVAGFIASRMPVFAQGKASTDEALPDTEWRHYAGDLGSHRYSPLDQINAGNFNDLEIAWRFKTDSFGPRPEYMYEGTPLLIKGLMYVTAGSRRDVVCLNPRTGEVIWMHSEDEGQRGVHAPRQLSGHGVAYWSDGKDERIVYVTPGYRLIALDAATGVLVKSFGVNGVVDLKMNDDQQIDLVTGEVGLHSTPVVAKNTIVVGAAHLSGDVPRYRTNVKGYVRGFDARTGKRKWIFHAIPRKGEFGYDTWLRKGDAERAGNAGAWAQMSVDLEFNTVYLPVELPTGDQVGIYREGPTLFSESIVAVDLDTGQRKWHYQTIHHGLWDRDIPCAAIICDIPHEGRIVKALAQPTKQGFLYVLDRQNGKPVWPIPETPVPAGDVPGEWYSPTQPIPSKPPAYSVQNVNADTRRRLQSADLGDDQRQLGLAVRARPSRRHQLAGRLLRSGHSDRVSVLAELGRGPRHRTGRSEIYAIRVRPRSAQRGGDARRPDGERQSAGAAPCDARRGVDGRWTAPAQAALWRHLGNRLEERRHRLAGRARRDAGQRQAPPCAQGPRHPAHRTPGHSRPSRDEDPGDLRRGRFRDDAIRRARRDAARLRQDDGR
jgi:quinoprotein glucose dehydrogenase